MPRSLDNFDRWTARDLPLILYHDRDEWVCYHTESGDTHLLELVPGTVLELLRQGELTSGELIRELQTRFEFEGDPNLAEYLDNILHRFELNALIRAVE